MTVRDNFIKKLVDSHAMAKVIMRNGYQLCGIITAFDDDALLVQGNQIEKVVMMQAVSTIVPVE